MIERLIKRITFTEGGCWEWTGCTTDFGYGQINIGGKKWLTHRLSYRLFVGEIPSGLKICHRCDNPPCIRPDHLFLATQKENIDDMMVKGRNMHKVCPETLARGDKNGSRTKPESVRRGEKIEWHKLTDEDVIEIRRSFNEGEMSAPELAVKFNVIVQTINKVVQGYTWKHIPDPYRRAERRRKWPIERKGN